nr:MAG TPA: minor capsid protein [Caudoviricetes sp.]
MLNNEQEEKLVQILIDRIQELNEVILKMIGKRIKQIRLATPQELTEIRKMLMNGEDLRKIFNLLSKVTNLNIQDVFDIYASEAKINQEYAKKFYDVRGVQYVPYSQNKALKEQIKALATITAREYANISKTTAIGYTIRDTKGNIVFKDISKTYKEILDKSILNVSTGKETFYEQIRKDLKQLGQSGLKTIDYESGRSIRLDSAIKMNVLGGVRDLTNTLQTQFGEEFGADGIEISVHQNPAEDHAPIQGKQFSLEEYQYIQNEMPFMDYKGRKYNAIKREIGQWNCYHYIFNIVLGVNKPQYSDEELAEIEENNKKGFKIDGKHYTNYEGTQLQRALEREIRKQKDIQILAKESGDKDLVSQSQTKITQLTNKYKQLCNISGLSNQLKTRGLVSGYGRVNVANM